MRKLLELYKTMLLEGYIEGVKISVLKELENPENNPEDEDVYIPTFEYVTGCSLVSEMEDFKEDALDSLDHLNYFNIVAFDISHHNMNEVNAPVLDIKVIIKVDDYDI